MFDKLNKSLSEGLIDNGFNVPKEFQEKCLPVIIAGRDLFGAGPLNSGKSTSILIAAVQKLKNAFEDAPRALIIVPNRDSAIKMEEEFKRLFPGINLRVKAVFEKQSIEIQRDEIYDGVDIVIGTPKRLQDIYFKNSLNLSQLKLFVIDDAEIIIRLGFQAPIDRLGESIPKCQHLVFAENLTDRVIKLASKFMIKPIVVEIS